MLTKGTAGILQRGTPQMDGVPGVTQVSWRPVLLKPMLVLTASAVPHFAGRQFHLPILAQG